jgi:hypothetical protein
MKRPNLRDHENSLSSNMDQHHVDLIKWSWWAEKKIFDLDEKLNVSGALNWIKKSHIGAKPLCDIDILVKLKSKKVIVATFSSFDHMYYDKDKTNISHDVMYYAQLCNL